MNKIINLLIEIRNEMNNNGIANILDSTIKNLKSFQNIDKLMNEEFVIKLSNIINEKLNVNYGLSIIDEYSNYIYEFIIVDYIECYNSLFVKELV